MPIGPFSTDYLEVNPGPAISGSTANLFAQEGERIRKKIEEDSAKAEAQAKGPVLAALYTDAYTKISQGDMSGFEKLSQAQLESSTNPFLASMAHDASVQAGKLAADYTEKSIAQLRFSQQSSREDKLLNRQEKLSAFKENQDIRQRNAQKRSDYERLKAAGVPVSEPVYEKEMALTDDGLFKLEGDLPTKSTESTASEINTSIVNEKRIKGPVEFGGYSIDINVPKMGRPEQTIGGVKVPAEDQDQKDADALAERLKVFNDTQHNLAKVLSSLVANGQKFHLVPIGKASDGQQKIELYINDKPWSETITTTEGRKTIQTDVPQQIPEKMFDLFTGKGKEEGIVQPFARLMQRGKLKINSPKGPSIDQIRSAEQDAVSRAKDNPSSIPQMNMALKEMGSNLVLKPEDYVKPAAAAAPAEAQSNPEVVSALKSEGIDIEAQKKQEQADAKAKAEKDKRFLDESVAQNIVNELPRAITDLKNRRQSLVLELQAMQKRGEAARDIEFRAKELTEIDKSIKESEDRLQEAKKNLKKT